MDQRVAHGMDGGRAGLGTGRRVARLPGGAQAVSTLVL